MRSPAAEVEQGLYAVGELRRLRNDVARTKWADAVDEDLHGLIEIVRSGAVVADYAITSAQRRDDQPVIRFGAAMNEMWSLRPQTAASSLTLTHLEASVATLAAFLPSAEEVELEPGGARGESEGELFPVAADDRYLASVTRIGERIRTVCQYRSTKHAARARRPWAAIANLRTALPPEFQVGRYIQPELAQDLDARMQPLISDVDHLDDLARR